MKAITDFLLVEDNDDDVLLLRQVFGKNGSNHRLHVVGDGREAIDYLEGKGVYADRAKYPLPDVILLDIKMPRLGGLEFLAWLNQDEFTDLRLIPVIVMSSSDNEKDVKKAYELGANCYLVKPVSWEAFAERMEKLNVFWGEHVQKPPVKA